MAMLVKNGASRLYRIIYGDKEGFWSFSCYKGHRLYENKLLTQPQNLK